MIYKAVIAGGLLFAILNIVPILVYLERRISAFIQGRLGPNRVGPFGLFQPLADAVKFIFKEDIFPAQSNRVLYFLAPMLVFIPPALGFAVLPFGNQIGSVKLQLADLSIGILFLMSVLSIGVYGLAFGGWASNNKYALLGGLRAGAQMISYELTLGMSILIAIMLAGSIDPQVIVSRQIDPQSTGIANVRPEVAGSFLSILNWNVFGGGHWSTALCGLLGCFLFYIAALAENNRLPFDLAECEAELVAGYHTEYSSMKFAMFFMGEYVAMILMSCLMVTLYLGGWHFPGLTDPADHSWWAGLLSIGVFLGKAFPILFLYIWIRWTLPRFRYDQLMNLGWKRLIPLSLFNVALCAAAGVLVRS